MKHIHLAAIATALCLFTLPCCSPQDDAPQRWEGEALTSPAATVSPWQRAENLPLCLSVCPWEAAGVEGLTSTSDTTATAFAVNLSDNPTIAADLTVCTATPRERWVFSGG